MPPMLVTREYRRDRAVLYARRYAFSQNPLFGDFRLLGGNCTNFVSQCLYAGCCRMNFRETFGWYYRSMQDRTPSWTGVEYFKNFLLENEGVGPFGSLTDAGDVTEGDVIQIGREDRGYYHAMLVVGRRGGDLLVAAQTDDAYERALSTYTYDFARFLRVLGVRHELYTAQNCFWSVYNGVALPADPDADAASDRAGGLSRES